ncbi:uncharacterized protein LOC143915476 isoform X2 [Arctopsyche grandis]|uniref:uncharacterized protein LOC143915476 isoform X2 n=1 Tax=Arctopsyche grandis TaxID=121162 RepID=UPI00406D941A
MAFSVGSRLSGFLLHVLQKSIVVFNDTHYRSAFPNFRQSAYVNKFLIITQVFTRSLALPCVVTYLYLIFGYSSHVAYVHLISGVLAVVMFLMKFGDYTTLIDVVLAGNIASLVYISYVFGNMWGVGLGVCHILNHFCLNQFEDILTAPVDCLFVVGMCFFNTFAIKTVRNY